MISIKTTSQLPSLDDEFITYDADFTPSLQKPISFNYIASYIKQLRTTIGGVVLPRFAEVIINDQPLNVTVNVKKFPDAQLNSFNGYKPAIKSMSGVKILQLFAIPIFKNAPEYLLINNIMLRYTNEISCDETGNKPSPMGRKRFRTIYD